MRNLPKGVLYRPYPWENMLEGRKRDHTVTCLAGNICTLQELMTIVDKVSWSVRHI